MEKEQYYFEIYKRYGNVRRARGHFLYTQKNMRLTDLFREEGRAILGWNSGAFSVLKNALSKNLTGSFITASHARLEKAVCALLRSNRKIFVYFHKNDALRACIFLNEFLKKKINSDSNAKNEFLKNDKEKENQNAQDFKKTFYCENNELVLQQNCAAFYKPFSACTKNPTDFSKTACVMLSPPLAWKNFFIVAALCDDKKNGAAFEAALKSRELFWQSLPPVLEEAFARSFYDLILAQKKLQEKDFFCYDKFLLKYWKRDGPYLFPKMSEKKYDRFVLHCLDCALAISPKYDENSIVPFGVADGVFKKLQNNPFEF